MSMSSTLADAGFNVQLVETELFIRALDDSGDLPEGQGMESFDNLLITKYMEIDPILYADLELMGIETPVLVEIEADGSWVLVDGHHRIAWALVHGVPVPVCFVTIDVDSLELYELLQDAA